MSLRLVLFIDAQNVYHRARELFCPDSSNHTDGQINPWMVAERIAARGGPRGETVEVEAVRIYTGYHTPERNHRAYSAYRKQRAFCEGLGCDVISRPIRYLGPEDRHGREKGIDVALSVDYVSFAVRGKFQVGVIFSMDTDLAPALEFVKSLNDPAIIPATAAWSAGPPVSQINVPGVWCHHLLRKDYQAVHDPTDYASPESVSDVAERLRASWSQRSD